MFRLYELTERKARAEELYLERVLDGLDPGDLSELIAETEADLATEIIQLARVKKNLDTAVEATETEEKRLREKRKRMEAAADRVRDRILGIFLDGQIEGPVRDGVLTVSMRRKPPRVEVDKLDVPMMTEAALLLNGRSLKVDVPVYFTELPDTRYLRVKVDIDVSKDQVKDDWKSTGTTPPAMHIINNEHTVVIR